MKNTLYNLFYYLSLLIAGLFILVIAFCSVNCFEIILSDGDFSMLEKFIYFGGILLSVAIEVGCYYLRIYLRKTIDFDEFGRSKKYNSYDKLSAKEKAKIDEQKLMDAERILDSNQLAKLTNEGVKNPDEEIEKLIGLENVKTEMKKLAARMAYDKKYRNKKQERPTMHMCFIGSPGTGKTTCARIMAGYLYKYGYIKKNKCIEVDGNFLKGRTNGETTEKVTRLIQYSMDGVLFIDEAYSILDKYGNGQEAIATLIKAMEDHRDRLVIILAGYEKEMQEFIDANSGIFSRIKHYMKFEDYSIPELKCIFKFMAKENGFKVSKNAMMKFEERMKIEKQQKYFGNARTVRNVLEKAVDAHAFNIMNKKIRQEYVNVLTEKDISVETEYQL